MPQQFAKRLALRIEFTSEDLRVFFECDGPFLGMRHLRPLAIWNDRPTEPVHVEGVVVQSTQINVGGNLRILKHIEEVLGQGLHHTNVTNWIVSLAFHLHSPPSLRIFLLLSSGHRKTAFALQRNVVLMLEKYGLERIGFLTLTFARHIVNYKESQKALHSLMTGVLRPRYPEYITVMERMDSGRIHYHLLVVMAADIRTGFDFKEVKRGDYRSANDYLRTEWKFWRETSPKYGFGRTELLPIRKTAEGVAKYIGKYVAKHVEQRLPEDKGARLVRYSKGTNRVGTRFSWMTAGAMMWRAKLGAFCRMLRLNSDNHQEGLRNWYGQHWVHLLRPLIESIKLPEYHPLEDSQASLRAVWVVALNERERCEGRKRKQDEPPRRAAAVAASGRTCGSWIERTLPQEET